MDPNIYPSPIPDGTSIATSIVNETNPQQNAQRKEGLATKIFHSLNAAGKRLHVGRQRKRSMVDLGNLSSESQELLLRAVEDIKKEDSLNIMVALDESRDMLRNSYEEFRQEQDEFRKKIDNIRRSREAAMQNRKENAIPISIFMRQKFDVEGLADLRPNSGMNTTYQAYFEALLAPNQNEQQHPSDKAAVIKYIRRRERQKRANRNRQNNQLTIDTIEKQTAELIEEMDEMDIKFENERQRQNELLRSKMNEKKIKSKTMMEASEIIDQAYEADLARQRVEQTHREKIEARLTVARSQQNRTSSNMIHVQSRSNLDDECSQLDDEQQAATNHSIQLLNKNDSIEKMTNIHI